MNPRVLYRAASYATDARSSADAVISALTPAAWYRNATGVTQAGGFASQWDDYSGNARHLVQGVGTNQPAYAAGVLTFDGVDNFMQAGAISIPPPFTFFIVAKQNSWTLNDAICDGGAVNQAALAQSATTPNIRVTSTGSTAENSNLAVGSWGIIAYGVKVAATSAFVQVNDTAETVGGNLLQSTLTAISLGNSFNSRYADVSVKEFILFPAVLSTTDRNSVITALNNALTVF